MLKLYNTLTKTTEDFQPIDPEEVKIYSCGPTVYNHAHIGNLASYVYADVLRRVVQLAAQAPVKHVMNFTDIDDKTIRDSRIRYPNLAPMEALKNLTTEYEEIFLVEMREIGNNTEDVLFVRATENIVAIQELIKKLLKNNVAYETDDGIYFSIKEYQKKRQYGQLAKISVGQARIENDEYDKDQASDFALWKKQKANEPAFEFALDDKDFTGRPGWHIECSVMSVKNLGQPFDIHTGGVDLVFPHHENEIAQSTAGDQPERLANYFVHTEHLLVDGKKMAKSANNFYTLSDIKNKKFRPLDFRLLVLQGHYQSATQFTWESLQSAQSRLDGWKDTFELTYQTKDSRDPAQLDAVNELVDKSIQALFSNLNTAQALSYIDQAFAIFKPENCNHLALTALSIFCSRELGLSVISLTDDISDEQKAKITNREKAKQDRDFATADALRSELAEEGIILSDTTSGTIWHRR